MVQAPACNDMAVEASHPGNPPLRLLRPAALVILDLSFAADPSAIRAVRRQLRAAVLKSVPGPVADDVAQAAQELMANAVEHGCRCCPPESVVRVKAVYSDEQVRVDVTDPSSERPRERPASDEQEDGRGLSIVGALADRWGVRANPVGAGKSVWCEFDAPVRRRAS